MERAAAIGGFLASRHRLRTMEAIPWLAAIAAYFLFPDYLQLGAQVLIMILFGLSLDMILGYAGIVSLGHAAFFGVGAYAAGILSAHGGWNEPISGLIAGGVAGAAFGFVSGWVILRTRGLTLLMLTLAFTILLQEFANQWQSVTGGDDGLQGIANDPVFGAFEFDIYGRTAYVYALATLFVVFLFARRIVNSPFGQSLRGIRENVGRMNAIGAPVHFRMVIIYTVAAAMAGIAGALLTQDTQFASLQTLSFEKSGDILIILILGGYGRLYGAFIGAPIYLVLQDQLAKASPEYWLLGVGLVLIVVVLFAPRGLLGLCEDAAAYLRRRRR
jgi:branched-chain amino acid transport system permease protein